jgi:hypothetical protein
MKYNYLQKLTLLFLFVVTSGFGNRAAQDMSVFDIARTGTLTQLKAAVAKDADIINKVSPEGYTPLTLACYYGNNEVAKYLIENVKNINSISGYGTPLMAATVKKNTELVKLLLENKANPNLTDQNGSTALHFCVIFSDVEIAKLLVEAEADATLKDNRGKSAEDYARITGNKDIMKLLNLN